MCVDSAQGTAPSARSGHRMVYVQKQLVVFGGFHDNLQNFQYFNDLHALDLEKRQWRRLEVSGERQGETEKETETERRPLKSVITECAIGGIAPCSLGHIVVKPDRDGCSHYLVSLS